MITMTITSMISMAIVIMMITIMMMIESRSQGTSLLLMVEKVSVSVQNV